MIKAYYDTSEKMEKLEKSMRILKSFYQDFDEMRKVVINLADKAELTQEEMKSVLLFREERLLYKEFLSMHIRLTEEFDEAQRMGQLRRFQFDDWWCLLNRCKQILAYVWDMTGACLRHKPLSESSVVGEKDADGDWCIPFAKRAFVEESVKSEGESGDGDGAEI